MWTNHKWHFGTVLSYNNRKQCTALNGCVMCSFNLRYNKLYSQKSANNIPFGEHQNTDQVTYQITLRWAVDKETP